nr:response regulator [Herbaspirillum sp. LeCh32-8]
MQLIALVDDDEAFREALRDLLDSAGIESIAFESCEKFLGDPRALKATCILLDINLPGMTGLELQRVLNWASITTPIIFLTSVDDAHARERAMTSGAAGFLTKPVDSTHLLSCIHALANSRKH